MTTDTSTVRSTSPQPDILQQVAVRVPCASCGRHYEVTLRQVLMSHDMLNDGCPVCSETECLPLTYAQFADEAAVRDFERSWARVAQVVRTAGLDLTFCRPPLVH